MQPPATTELEDAADHSPNFFPSSLKLLQRTEFRLSLLVKRRCGFLAERFVVFLTSSLSRMDAFFIASFSFSLSLTEKD